MNTTKQTGIESLESLARVLVEKTGCTLDEARTGIRIELARMSAGLGLLTLDEANVYLAGARIGARVVRK